MTTLKFDICFYQFFLNRRSAINGTTIKTAMPEERHGMNMSIGQYG